MKITLKKGQLDTNSIMEIINQDIREKITKLRYSKELKHYVDELQKDVVIEWKVVIKKSKSKV